MDELERERRALQVFAEVCALPAEQRTAALAARCGGDSLLRERVEALLGADERPITAFGDEAGPREYLASQLRGIAGEGAADAPGEVSRLPGHYRILRVLGEGGMATVYEAEQVHPRRQVAIKVVRGGLFSPELRRRFEYEAQVLAGLQHPGIAQLYEAETRPEHLGDRRGVQAYLAMELVRGVPLDEYAAAHKLDVHDKVRMLVRVCDAVEYAHRVGVIHRDLKPANILVDATGQPKVLDFGVARVIRREQGELAATITHAGQLVGTLPYMSPEQVDPRRGPTDTRCDVYALGVLLYKLLTGTLPIDVGEDGVAAAVERVCSVEPPKLGARDRRLRGDLEAVVAKALEKDPERRYPSVQALAVDLQRFLGGRAVEARGDSGLYVLRKAAWRHRRVVTVALAFVAVLVWFGVYAGVQSTRNRRLADDATAARDQSVSAREVADARARALRRSLYLSNIGFAQSALGNNDTARAVSLLAACPGDLRGWEWQYLRNQTDQSLVAAKLAPRTANSVDVSGDQARVVIGTTDGVALCVDADGRTTLFERQFPGGGLVAVAISADGGRVACGVWTDELFVIDATTGREVWRPGPTTRPRQPWMRRLRALRFSPDGQVLATAGYDGHVRIHEAATGRLLREIDAGCLSVLCLAFTRDGRAVAGADNTGMVRLWRVADGAVLHEAQAHDEAVGSLALSADDAQLVTGGSDGYVSVRSVADWAETARLRLGDSNVWSVAFAPGGDALALGSDDNLVRVWRPKVSAPPAVLRGHGAAVKFVGFAADVHRITSVAADSTLRRWRTDRTAGTLTFTPGHTMTFDAAFAPDGGVIVACNDGSVRFWDTSADVERWRNAGPEITTLRSLAIDPRGNRIMAAEDTGTVRLIDLADGRTTGTLTCGDSSGVAAVSLSPDGKTLAAAYRGGAVRLWNLAEGRVVAEVAAAHSGSVAALAYAPGGARLVTVGGDGHVKLWSAPGLTLIMDSGPSGAPANEVKFAPAGDRIAVGRENGTVSLLDATSLQSLGDLRGHVGPVVGLAFHPGGTRLASGGTDRTIRLWEMTGGQEVLTLRGHLRTVHRISFSPDGTALASSGGDRTARLWNASPRSAEILGVR